ncbi:MAG: hypothetical protein V1743_07060 [Nanoarchaeota archaeon]
MASTPSTGKSITPEQAEQLKQTVKNAKLAPAIESFVSHLHLMFKKTSSKDLQEVIKQALKHLEETLKNARKLDGVGVAPGKEKEGKEKKVKEMLESTGTKLKGAGDFLKAGIGHLARRMKTLFGKKEYTPEEVRQSLTRVSLDVNEILDRFGKKLLESKDELDHIAGSLKKGADLPLIDIHTIPKEELIKLCVDQSDAIARFISEVVMMRSALDAKFKELFDLLAPENIPPESDKRKKYLYGIMEEYEQLVDNRVLPRLAQISNVLEGQILDRISYAVRRINTT